MPIKVTVAVRNAMAQDIVDAIDAGAANGIVKILSGIQPVGPHIAISDQVALSEHLLSKPCATIANGIITFAPISDDDFANATGAATWARFFDSNGNAVADATVSLAGGGGDLQMNTVNFVINGPVRFTSLSWVMPGA